MLRLGGTLSCVECDTEITLGRVVLYAGCVPTTTDGKVIEPFDFKPFDSNPEPAVYLAGYYEENGTYHSVIEEGDGLIPIKDLEW